MPRPQTKRLMIANFLGIKRTCEKHTAPKKARLEKSRAVVFGDGLSTVDYNDDPAIGCDPITLRYIGKKDDPFITGVDEVFQRHKDDPNSAEPVLLISYLDSGAVGATKTAVKAVIQSVAWPEGDTLSHDETMIEIEVQPRGIL